MLFILLIAAQAVVLALAYGRIRIFAALHNEQLGIGELRTELLALRIAAIDAETGQRGFLISGREEFLQPYRAAVLTFTSRLERLSALTANKPTLVPKLQAVAALLKTVREDLAQLVEVRRRDGFDVARQQLLDGVQREGMIELRALIIEMEDAAERQAQAQVRNQLHASSALIALTFFALCGGLFVIASLGVFLLARLSVLATTLGKPLLDVTRELRAESRAVVRDAAKLLALSHNDANTKAEGQATVEVVTRMAKDLSTLAMELTSSVRVLAENSQVKEPDQEAAQLERLISLSGRVAQSALSIELMTADQRRLFDGAASFLSGFEKSVSSVSQAAGRVKKLAKNLLELLQGLPDSEAFLSSDPATSEKSDFEISPTRN